MPPVQNYTEQELVAELKDHRPEAFTYLYNNYKGAIFSLVLQFIPEHSAAEDVLQEVFVAAWRNIDKYDPKKGRIFTWLHTIARNTSINTLRSRQFKDSQKNETLADFVSNTAPQLFTSNNVNHIGLRKMIHGLRDEYKTVLELYYFNGFTHEEVAKNLGLPLGTVKTRLRSAIIELRKLF